MVIPGHYSLDDGTMVWLNDRGQLHNTEGPAIIFTDGGQEWYKHGKRHRVDGPAVIYPSGLAKWYLNDRRIRDWAAFRRYSGVSNEAITLVMLRYTEIL